MNNEITKRLDQLGLHSGWFEYGFVDKAFVDNAFSKLSLSDNDHNRIPFYSKFFKDRQATGIDNDEIEKYFILVNYEKDPLLKSWAIGFLVESSCLTVTQLLRLSEHDLIKSSEKHLFFLQQNLAEKNKLQPK